MRSTLLDLLEVPSLMETCVRNGNLDEALDLDAAVARLAQQAAALPLAARLEEQSRAQMRAMLDALMARLRGAVQLPECLRIVGYLRRMARSRTAPLPHRGPTACARFRVGLRWPSLARCAGGA